MHIKTSSQQSLKLGYKDYTCNWGVHFAGLYKSEQERDEILFGYLEQGRQDGDLQLYCPVERSREEFFRDYQIHCPDCGDNIASDENVVVNTAKELYYPDGTFSPHHMDTSLNSFYQESQQNGKRHVRATANMSWALQAIPGIDHLMAYESRLNYFIPGKPWISICLYDVNRFSGAMIMKVLQTHPYTITDGVVTKNPYFQDPDEWLKNNAPQFLPSHS